MLEDKGTITRFLGLLVTGTDAEKSQAAGFIVDQFLRAITQVARRAFQQLRVRGAMEDADGVADLTLAQFIKGVANGEYAPKGRAEAEMLLRTMVRCEAINEAQKEHASMRDFKRRVDEAELTGGSADADGINGFPGDEIDPVVSVQAEEEIRRLLDLLGPDMMLRKIVLGKLLGHKNDELATLLGFVEPTIESKLNIIRHKLAGEYPGLTAKAGRRPGPDGPRLAASTPDTTVILRSFIGPVFQE